MLKMILSKIFTYRIKKAARIKEFDKDFARELNFEDTKFPGIFTM